MYKKFIMFAIAIALLLSFALTLSACNFAQFMQYQHQEGMTILLMDDSDNFRTQFHFVVVLERDASRTEINEMDSFFHTFLNANLDDSVTRPVAQGTQPERPAFESAGSRILFVYELIRPRGANENYRFDPNFASVIYVNDNEGAFFMARTTRHSNPFSKIDFHNELITDGYSPFYENEDISFIVLMGLARNRSDIEGGRRVALNAVFYAEFMGTDSEVMQVNTRVMVVWHWFLLAGGIAIVVMVPILIFGKKGGGRLVKVNRIVADRFGRIVTIDAAGMPVNQGEVFEELGAVSGSDENDNKDIDVFEGF